MSSEHAARWFWDQAEDGDALDGIGVTTVAIRPAFYAALCRVVASALDLNERERGCLNTSFLQWVDEMPDALPAESGVA